MDCETCFLLYFKAFFFSLHLLDDLIGQVPALLRIAYQLERFPSLLNN
jgi:uncharacterized membrane protein YuzA (DUF378 family)